MAHRLFFAAGPGDIIAAHQASVSDQMSVTFSSEFEDLCRAQNACGLMISSHQRAAHLQSGNLTLENRPKKVAAGWRFHLEEIRYGIGLALAAKRFRATHAFVQSGSTHYFVMTAFRLFGIKVTPIMHNTLWPAGYPDASLVKRIIRWADGQFFRRAASSILAVSPECRRQVETLTAGHHHARIELFTIQFNADRFKQCVPTPLKAPLVVTFAGRLTENKGALDVVEIARLTAQKIECELHICGDGPAMVGVIHLIAQHRMTGTVHVHGWTAPARLREILSGSHLAIVPTRSDFNEGMAMTVIEPILLGRPVVTNSVVPASEVLHDACVLATTDDPESYADALVALAADPVRYAELCKACVSLRDQFFDRSRSSQSAMMNCLS